LRVQISAQYSDEETTNVVFITNIIMTVTMFKKEEVAHEMRKREREEQVRVFDAEPAVHVYLAR